MNLARRRSLRRCRDELDGVSAMLFALPCVGARQVDFRAVNLGEVSGAPRLASGCAAEEDAVNISAQLEQSPQSTDEIWLWNDQI